MAADLRLVRDGGRAVPLRWRGFEAPDALALNFDATPRPSLVTEVLARCRSDAAGDAADRTAEARELTLSGRIGGLAAIVARATSSSEIALELRCPAEDCRTELQVTLSLASVLDLGQEAEVSRSIAVMPPGAEALQVRRPTGNDQHAWQARAYPDEASAERAMMASLLPSSSGSALTSETIAAIDRALEEADPLTCLRVTTACPACGRESDHGVDLEGVLLARLQRLQRSVFYDIHRLAARYGWTEEALAAMPSWRRRAYLDLLDREGR